MPPIKTAAAPRGGEHAIDDRRPDRRSGCVRLEPQSELTAVPVGGVCRTESYLARLAKIRWRIEHDYRELNDGLGLDHFEGRSWTGWHRHVTLAAVAQAICTQLRRTPKAPAQA